MAALADEKGRQESELRQRRLRRRTSSPTDDVMMDYEPRMQTKDYGSDNRRNLSPEKKSDHYDGIHHGGHGKNGSEGPREMLEAAARASLRSKFDHVGLDSHSSEGRDVRSIAENRGMTNSPPPPSLSMSAALTGHGGAAGFVRQHHPEQNPDHSSIARVSSPILFSHGGESPTHASANMHMLQLHHAAALAGDSMGSAGSSPFDLSLDGRTQGNLGGSENADLEVRFTNCKKCSSFELRFIHNISHCLGLFLFRWNMVALRRQIPMSIRSRMMFLWMIRHPTAVMGRIRDRCPTMNRLRLPEPWR